MHRSLPLYLALLLVGGAAGYGLRQWAAAGSSAVSATSVRMAGSARPAASPARAQSSPSPGFPSATVIAFQQAADLPATEENRPALTAAVDQLELADIPAALEIALRQPAHEMRLLRQILTRWAELEPRAAADYTLGLSRLKADDRESLLEKITLEWAVIDHASARGWVMALKNPSELKTAAKGLLQGMAAQDPAAAFAFLQGLPAADQLGQPYQVIFDEWARHDPAAAASQALKLTTGKLQSDTVEAVLTRWAYQDPEAALAWTKNLPDAGARSDAEKNIFYCWMGFAPEQAGRAALQRLSGPIQTSIISVLAGKIALHDLEHAKEWARSLPNEAQQAEAMLSIGGFLRRNDPGLAVQHLAALPSNAQRDESLNRVLYEWSERDPKATADFIEANFAGTERSQALQSLYSWGRNSPQEAIAWMEQHGHQSVDDLTWIASAWGDAQPQAALAWARRRPSEPERAQLIGAVVSALASTNPQPAAEMLANLPPDDRLAESAGHVAAAWTYRDPRAAAAWAEQLPNEAMRREAFEKIAATWGMSDHGQVASWLEKLPEGTARDAAVSSFVGTTSVQDPALGASWGERITDPTQRLIALERNYQLWLYRNWEEAQRWLRQTSALSAEVKAAIQQ